MKRRLISLSLLSLLAIGQVAAQNLQTTTQTYDCGQVLFRQPITTQFVLHNNTGKQIVINKVLTSCGCTTAVTKNRAVDAGADLTVDATYDAKLLGHFQKEIWIYEEGQDQPLELILKGVVVAEKQDFGGTYPYTLGQISADKNGIEFDDVNKGLMPSQRIHIRNTTTETIEPVVMHLPQWLKAEVSPTRLAPNQAGEINFTLMSENVHHLGLTQSSVFLGKFPGDKVAPDKEIEASVVLIPSTRDLDDGNPNAPELTLSAESIKRSEMSGSSDKLKGEIVVKNAGRSMLEISSLQMFTIGVQVEMSKTKLKAGESTKLKIRVNENELKMAKSQPRILMITNDPKQPKVIINIEE